MAQSENKELKTLIQDFKLKVSFPWGDFTPHDKEDIDDLVEKTAIYFYNKGIEKERYNMLHHMQEMREQMNDDLIKEYEINIVDLIK